MKQFSIEIRAFSYIECCGECGYSFSNAADLFEDGVLIASWDRENYRNDWDEERLLETVKEYISGLLGRPVTSEDYVVLE